MCARESRLVMFYFRLNEIVVRVFFRPGVQVGFAEREKAKVRVRRFSVLQDMFV